MKPSVAAIALLLAAGLPALGHAQTPPHDKASLEAGIEQQRALVKKLIPSVGVFGAYPGSPVEIKLKDGLVSEPVRTAMLAVSSAAASATGGQGFVATADNYTLVAAVTYHPDSAKLCRTVTWFAHRGTVTDTAKLSSIFSATPARSDLLARAYTVAFNHSPVFAQNVICLMNGRAGVYMDKASLNLPEWKADGYTLSLQAADWTVFGEFAPVAPSKGVATFTFTPKLPEIRLRLP